MVKHSKGTTPLRLVAKSPQDPDRSKVRYKSAEVYSVTGKNGMDRASIFLDYGRRSADEHWGTISISSSFGEIGHTFTNTGPRSLKRFLIGLEFSYLTGKLFGDRARVFDLQKSIAQMRKSVLDTQAEGQLDADVVLEAQQAFKAAEHSGITDANGLSLLLQTEAPRAFTELELWRDYATAPNPQAEGFWEQIWCPFVEHLKIELSQVA